MRFQQTLGVDKLLLRGDRRRWRQLQSKSTEPSNNLVTGFYGASDFLVDGEVENWRPDNSPFGFSGVRHVSWPGTRIDR